MPAVNTGVYAHLEVSTETLIASGVLTLTTSRPVIVGAQSGTADDLDTLTVTNTEITSGYQVIVFMTATIGDTITIKHNTGNILCNTGADITLTENKAVMLVRFISTTNSVVNNKWRAFG